ncbi:MAG: hypothetical protein J5966_09390 [Lachnospiraceae bacterium]|nr:hypothetical protein [Lachnospiraceae bacterium]
MDGLSKEQAALFASIMQNSSQASALNPAIPAPVEEKKDDNPNRLLSQAEIDALIASMTG